MNAVQQKEIVFSRPTWAEIDLSAIQNNINQIRGCIDRYTKILAVVKANAYGHSMIEVSKKIISMVDYLGVATVDEGVNLRRNGIKLPILIMSAILPDEAEQVVENDLIATVFTKKVVLKLSKQAQNMGKNVKIHVKVDTGMGRIGMWYKKAKDFMLEIRNLPNLEIEGIYTHFPSAEEDSDFTFKQIRRFNYVLGELESCGINIPLTHASNSAATVKFKQAHFNLIRPGLMIYGVYPHLGLRKQINLEPSLSLKSRLTYIKKVKKGRSISYGRTFITNKDTLIGTIPIGYGDGYPHILSNKAKVLIRGKFVPIVGRICMDQLMVNLNSIPEAKIGEEVVLIGKQGSSEIKVEEIAQLADTIPYEILCFIGSRVPRVFK